MPAAKLIGEPSRLIQMYDIANMGIYFGIAKEKEEKKPCQIYFMARQKIRLLPIIFSI